MFDGETALYYFAKGPAYKLLHTRNRLSSKQGNVIPQPTNYKGGH